MTVFTNSSGISIPDASATAQTLQVGSLTGTVTRLSVRIAGLSHPLQDQLDFLLVAPDGTHNLVFWSDAGGPNVVAGATVTVADAGAAPLPATTAIPDGTSNQPADYDVAEADAMFGSPLVAPNHATTNGSATFASAFNAIDPNGIWTLYVADDTAGGTGSIVSWSLDFAVGGAAVVGGTAGADTLVINATGPDSASYVLNGGPPIDLIGVTSFTFNGGDGNDSVTINNPAGGLFGPAGGIFINGGAQTGPPGDSLTLAGGSGGQATYSFGPTPDAGTIVSADQEVQRIALGGAGNGSFSLTFNGQTTAQLSAAATAAEVQAALNALSSIGGVGGSVVAVQSGTTFTITFGGSLVATDVPQMTGSGTGGTTVGVTTLNDGSAAVQSITYTGLDPIDMTGSTVTDLVFILPSSADQAVFDDDGVVANNFSQLRSNNGTFETVAFMNPASSITLNAGAGDSVDVNFLDSLGSADLTIGSLTNAAVRPDSISLNNVVTAGVVNLAATGGISEGAFDPGADITAGGLAMLASGGIGTFLQRLDLQVSTIAASNVGSGIVGFDNFGPLVIGTVSGLVGITATGDVLINESGVGAGNLTVASDVSSLAGLVSLRAVGPGSMLTSNAAISAGTALFGHIFLSADRMALAGGSASAAANVFLAPLTGGAIDLGSQTDAAAGTLELSDAELDTISTSSLHVGNGITGNITVSSPLSGSGHYGTLALTCLGAISDATASEQADLTVPVLALDASGIGASDDLDTAVGRLVFFNRAGAVNISNTGPLTLTSSSFNSGTTTTVSTSSPLSIDGSVTSVGDLTLTAADSAASGDDLTIAVVGGLFIGALAASSSGNVILSAGDDFILNPLGSIMAAGAIDITVDAGNADPGVGGTADIRNGTLSAVSINLIGRGDGDTLLGGAAGENFIGFGGDDLIAGGGGNNVVNGGAGNDTADYAAAPDRVVIDLAAGGAVMNGFGGADFFNGIENANGSAFSDFLRGDANDNVLRGNGDVSGDLLIGGAGSDTATYSGNAADYGVIFGFGGELSIGDLRPGAPDGGDGLTEFEAMQFADGTMPIMFGTAGDDSYIAAGLQLIRAGDGIDTITFDFRLVDATVTFYFNSVVIDGPSSHTVLGGFERFVFTDGTVDNADDDRLVDDLFYYSRYHDVWNAQADADQHYHGFGWHELRDPNAFFSTLVYRSAYPDVAAAEVDPLSHFDRIGWTEGRTPSLDFDPRPYLRVNSDVAAAHVDPLLHYLAFGHQEERLPISTTALIAANGFDYVWYLNHNPDVAAAHVDPLVHFQTIGWQEGRNPNALFDTAGYLATYADVAAAHVSPLDHYNQFGWHEGRDPSVGFDTTAYLAAYPDVAAAHVNPLTHYLQYGIHEGRSAFADGVWG
jgi:hypothetical protein